MKSSEIKELSIQEILERIDNETAALTRMKLNHAITPLDNPNVISESRKVIARLRTELRHRELNDKQNS